MNEDAIIVTVPIIEPDHLTGILRIGKTARVSFLGCQRQEEDVYICVCIRVREDEEEVG